MMIDKVELRIPNFIHFAGPFNRLFRDLRNDPKGPFHPSQHYMTVGDLRDFGYPAILHMHNVHDKRGNHKLELVETGAMAYSQMRHEIERVFAVNTNRDGLELMRLDLAADIEGVPVSWFERNIQAKWKRFTAGIGTIGEPVEFSEMGSKGIQTFYFGRRPNVFRIYDKVAERQYRYRQWIARARRRGTPDAEIPTFEQMFGHSESSFILTRVERQMAAGKVPEVLSTFVSCVVPPSLTPLQVSFLQVSAGQSPTPTITIFLLFVWACIYGR